MAKTKTYKEKIVAQVKADHGGEVPKHLQLTIDNYAAALELRDVYRSEVIKAPVKIEVGSTGQMITRQHPLAALLYQQDMLCLSYAKALGGTAAKAASKPEDAADRKATNSMDEFIEGITG
jgi:hypothetical protein